LDRKGVALPSSSKKSVEIFLQSMRDSNYQSNVSVLLRAMKLYTWKL